ncbi:MAG: SURF1 family protein [Betaproteobacteria bacterium]|nr:SURF1 family protein [Betaproteobacteria bacterium]
MANNNRTTTILSIGTPADPLSPHQYAPPRSGPTSAARRRTALLGGLLVALLVPAFVSLGLWQWRKAETKTATQAERDARSADAPVAMPVTPADVESLRHRRVVLRGRFDASRQVLIDNRLHRERAGYHVITPLQLEGSAMHVLVNRGWLPAPPDHRILPVADVPDGMVEMTGVVVLPGQRFFNLAPQPAAGWAPVWQNLDLSRFTDAVPYPLQPLVVQLDPAAPAGYLREWPRPDERADRHRSYALQWFGFALSTVGIWLFLVLRRA